MDIFHKGFIISLSTRVWQKGLVQNTIFSHPTIYKNRNSPSLSPMVSADDLPENVLRFIRHCLDSVEQLRVILVLQSEPNREWTVTELTTELRSTEASIRMRLQALYDRNVLAHDSSTCDKHRFSPASAETAEVIQALVEQNQLRPLRIIDAIYAQPSKTLLAFADAFKLRSDKS